MKPIFIALFSCFLSFCCLGQELYQPYIGYSEDTMWNKLKIEISLRFKSANNVELVLGYKSLGIGAFLYGSIDTVLITYQRHENKLLLNLSTCSLKQPTNNNPSSIFKFKDPRIEIIDYFNNFIAKNQNIHLDLTTDSCLIDEKNKMIYVSTQTINLMKQKYPKGAIMFAYDNQTVIIDNKTQGDTSKLFKEIEKIASKKQIAKISLYKGLSAYKKGGIDGVVLGGVMALYKRKSLLHRWFGRKEN